MNNDHIIYLSDTDSQSSYSIGYENEYHKYSTANIFNKYTSKNLSLKTSLFICFYTCLISLFLYGPFTVLNIYFSLTDTSCVLKGITNTNYDLNSWLIGDGLAMFFSCFVLWIMMVYKKNFNKVSLFLKFINYMVLLTNFSVSIYGSVLYWKYVYPLNLCSNAINIYLWIRLILSYFVIVIHYFLSK